MVSATPLTRMLSTTPGVFLGIVCLLLAPAASAVVVLLDPADTYLRVDTGIDSAGDTTPIDLSALGIGAGDTVRLTRVGDFVGVSGGPDNSTAQAAVFSSSATLLSQTVVNRVQDAIDAGTDYATAPTFPNNLPTDIAEDFFVPGTGVELTVPSGATQLFVAVPDNLYGDNSDPDNDYGVDVVLIPSNRIYWTDNDDGKIRRANVDGSNVEELVTGLTNPLGISLDVVGGKMYWTDNMDDTVSRADLDGSNVEVLVSSGLDNPFGIEVDVANAKVYWADDGTSKIQRSNLDGSSVEDIVSDPASLFPLGVTLDSGGDELFWTGGNSGTGGKVRSSDLSGGGAADLITGLQGPAGPDLDLVGGKIYWASFFGDKITRADLDGSNVEDLVSTGASSRPRDVAVDPGGRMYFTLDVAGALQSANLDGSDVQDVLTGLTSPIHLDIDFSTPVPEPSGTTALLSGVGALILLYRRRAAWRSGGG
jgi:sugar lactone lactonase YvrE